MMTIIEANAINLDKTNIKIKDKKLRGRKRQKQRES